ncbi:MAG: NAD-dependent epimerase/dehydratase family protein [Rhodospirillales bacterium]|nr:NAD-dependent epimerase/dehydratase family protein [Rhodospirillales bacterium]
MAEQALVTGATGFVGAAVARALIAEGFAVRALARQHSPRTNLEGLAVEVAEGDLTDPASLKRAAAGCTAVFHVAADYRLWTRDAAAMFRVNVEGSRAVILAAMEAGARRIVYTSSVATLGIPGGGVSGDESTPVGFADMIGPYKQSKFKAEEAVRRLIAEKNAPVVIVNPSTPIGPGDVKPTPTGRMIVEAARGRMPAFVDTGLNVVHVDDVAAGHILALRKGRVGERYVLGGENMALGDILAEIARLCGRRPPTIRIPHGAVLPIAVLAEAWARLIPGAAEPFVTVDGIKMARKKMFFSSAKAARELGYVSRPAVRALEDAVDWFRRHGRLG